MQSAEPLIERYRPPLDAHAPIPSVLSDAIEERDRCLRIMEQIAEVTPIRPGARLTPEQSDWRRRAKVTRRLAQARYLVLRDHCKEIRHRQLMEESENVPPKVAVRRAAFQIVDLTETGASIEAIQAAYANLRSAVTQCREFFAVQNQPRPIRKGQER